MAKTDGTDLAKKTSGDANKHPQTLKDWIKSKKNEITMALPEGYSVGQMESVLINTLRENPNLSKCTPISFICAAMQAVQLGLKPNTALGHCYIIPYWNSKLKCYEAQYQMGYKGILELGYRTDEFTEIYSEKVLKGDLFEYELGTDKFLRHKPRPEKWEYDKSTGMPIVTHYYAIYKTVKGGMHFVVWTREQILKHRDRFSPASKKDAFSPWITSEDQMAKKTTLKDVMNYAPLSEKDKRILAADETVKRELSKNMLEAPAVYEFSPDDITGMDDENLETGEGKKETGKKEDKKKTEKTTGTDKDKKLVTEDQLKRYYAMVKDTGLEIEKVDAWVKETYKVEHKKDLTMEQIDKIFIALDKKIDAKKIADDFEKSEQGKGEKVELKVTEEKLKEIFELGGRLHIEEKDLNNTIKIKYKLNNTKDMTESQAAKIFKELKNEVDKSNKEAEEIEKGIEELEEKEKGEKEEKTTDLKDLSEEEKEKEMDDFWFGEKK